MALQVMPKPRPHLAHIDPQHRAAFAAVLLQLPAAAEAIRRARAKRPAPPRTVFILDWDDTCCATSYLERCGFMADLDTRIDECAPELARHLRVLESRVLSLLKTAVSLGTVLIVTNAGDGWVELSSSRFLPAVRAFLEYNYKLVKIISARARYVDVYREHPLQWKALTFFDELRPILADSRQPGQDLHVVVLGDSVGDQYAAHVAANSLTAAGMPIVLKVVKFLERPSIDQLCKELGVLLDHIGAMTAHKGAFDVSMYKEAPQAQHQQQAQQMHGHFHHQQSVPMQTSVDQKPTPSQPAPAVAAATSEAQHAAMSPVSPMAACAAAV